MKVYVMRTHNIIFLISILLLTPFINGTTWSGGTISSNVVDDNITISGTNTLANNISVTATNTDILITIAGSATLSDGGNGYTLSLITTSTAHSILIQIGGSTLTIANNLTFNIQQATTLQLSGGSLIVQDNAKLLADPMAGA